MTTSEQLEVAFVSENERSIYFASVWAGTDLADIPLLAEDGISADVNAFPWGAGADVGEVTSYTTTVTLDSGASCSASASYSLYIAGFAIFGDACVPPRGTFIWDSDEPVWVNDVDNYQESDDQKFTYIEIPITCDCVPGARRRLEEVPFMLPTGASFGAEQHLRGRSFG